MQSHKENVISIPAWPRPWAMGPSDAHLHAIGQIVCNYSSVELLIHLLFEAVLGDATLASDLVHKLGINTGNEPDFIIERLKNPRFHQGAAQHASSAILRFKKSKDTRHKVIHWISAVQSDDTAKATFTNFIRRKPNGEQEPAKLSLEELRSYAHTLATIVRDLGEALSILAMPKAEAVAMLEALHTVNTSPERPQQSHRLLDLFYRKE